MDPGAAGEFYGLLARFLVAANAASVSRIAAVSSIQPSSDVIAEYAVTLTAQTTRRPRRPRSRAIVDTSPIGDAGGTAADRGRARRALRGLPPLRRHEVAKIEGRNCCIPAIGAGHTAAGQSFGRDGPLTARCRDLTVADRLSFRVAPARSTVYTTRQTSRPRRRRCPGLCPCGEGGGEPTSTRMPLALPIRRTEEGSAAVRPR